eukprot:scaffold22650_cov55-Phaeocystis_antarctica.AAC.3
MPPMRCRRPMPPRLPAHTSLRIARPPFHSAVRVGVQPAAELRHVQRHGHVLHVPGALRACPIAPPAFTAGTFRRACRSCAAAGPRPPAPGPYLAPHRTPCFLLGSTQTPCPTPTSCSSVARGRAPRPSPLLATARAGVREAAPEDRLLVSSWLTQSLWQLLSATARFLHVAVTDTHAGWREGGNLRRFFGALDEPRTRRGARVLQPLLLSPLGGGGVLWAPLRPRRLSKPIWGKRSGGEGGRGSEMTRLVTLKLTGEMPARGEASLGPGAFTRRTAYILRVCACPEGSLLFACRS